MDNRGIPKPDIPNVNIASPYLPDTSQPVTDQQNTAAQVQAPAVVNPYQTTVTDDQTVQGQVKKIIDENSPLMQQAQTRANQQMNQRGLINSSMAVGAGQAALYDAAVPIAASDAQTNNKVALDNTQAKNQFATANNTQSYDMSKMDKAFQQTTAQLQQKFGYDEALMNLNNENQIKITNLTAQYRNLTQASASATNLIANSADNIHQIMINPNLDTAAKQAAIDTYNINLNNALRLVGLFAGDVDLSTMLDELLA